MSSLVFRGPADGTKMSLARRYHDAGGTDYIRIGALPESARDAIRQGGEIRIALREEVGPDIAPWIMSVEHNGESFPCCYITDSALSVLREQEDWIPVVVEDEPVTLARRKLQLAQIEAGRAKDAYAAALQEVDRLERQIQTIAPGSSTLRVTTSDGKYTVLAHPDDGAQALRQGEPWRDLNDDDFILTLAADLQAARREAEELGIDPCQGLPEDVLRGSEVEGSDLLRVSLSCGAVFIQSQTGATRLEREGEAPLDMTGDNLALGLAYDLEEVRTLLVHVMHHPDQGPEM